MDIARQYQAATKSSEFSIREYVTPVLHVDPRKQIIDRKYDDYKNKPAQKKFKPTTKHKPCFLDEQIEPFVANPSPDKYKTMTSGFAQNNEKTKRHKSADLKKVDAKIKRGSYIDDIEHFQSKLKQPGVGKYDITKDPYKRKILNIKPKELPQKISNMDDVCFLANVAPGAGFYNPHKSVPHLRTNRTDYKFWKAKHIEDEKKVRNAKSAKIGPSTYQPIVADTFDSILKRKGSERSRWSHGTIEIRKGSQSQIKSPSPAEYKLMNQWMPRNAGERQSQLGKVKLFYRTSRSAKSLSVYH